MLRYWANVRLFFSRPSLRTREQEWPRHKERYGYLRLQWSAQMHLRIRCLSPRKSWRQGEAIRRRKTRSRKRGRRVGRAQRFVVASGVFLYFAAPATLPPSHAKPAVCCVLNLRRINLCALVFVIKVCLPFSFIASSNPCGSTCMMGVIGASLFVLIVIVGSFVMWRYRWEAFAKHSLVPVVSSESLEAVD